MYNNENSTNHKSD